MDILDQATLVLNRHWQPIHVTTVVRALVMLCRRQEISWTLQSSIATLAEWEN